MLCSAVLCLEGCVICTEAVQLETAPLTHVPPFSSICVIPNPPQVTYRVLEKLGRKDGLLDVAMELEKIALQDEYFVKR